MRKKEIRVRCWIAIGGEKFFGPGPAELLGLIEEHGSITKAAKKMGMSYKKAWDLVDDLNTRGRHPYVISHKGGRRGGGAVLTAAGKRILKAYSLMLTRLNAVLGRHRSILKLV